jgi:Anti-sigma-K factor rskA
MSDTRPQGQPDEAMVDLLIKQVTEGLSPAEQRALDVMDTAAASEYLRQLEHATAAITLAAATDREPLPAELARRLAGQANEHFASLGREGKVVDLGSARSAASSRESNHAANRGGAYGWLAAAACLVLAIFGWVRSPSPPPAPIAQEATPPAAIVPPIEKPVVAPTATEERAALLAKADTLKVALGATKDPAAAGVTGDVVWDPATQRGFLHFSGLAANDPAVHQYQIWIFDGARDKRFPVDGGVFDIPANTSDVVIPIRAALMVHKPAAFAVTVEKPGGVVVSGREHVVALGAGS